jgi:hypothetical protein
LCNAGSIRDLPSAAHTGISDQGHPHGRRVREPLGQLQGAPTEHSLKLCDTLRHLHRLGCSCHDSLLLTLSSEQRERQEDCQRTSPNLPREKGQERLLPPPALEKNSPLGYSSRLAKYRTRRALFKAIEISRSDLLVTPVSRAVRASQTLLNFSVTRGTCVASGEGVSPKLLKES